MPAIKKTIHFAFERGERVWLVCDPLASGTIDGYTLREEPTRQRKKVSGK